MKRLMGILLIIFPALIFAHEGKKHKDKAGEVEGVISGAVCGIHGMKCEHKPGEHGYELLGLFSDKKGFFYLANVPQEVLQNINRSEVVVVGKIFRERATILVRKIIKDGNVVWSFEEHEMKGEENKEKEKH